MSSKPRSRKWTLVGIGLLLLASILIVLWISKSPAKVVQFDGARALEDARVQLDFGPRVPGSEAHARTIEYIQSELVKAGWTVEIQNFELEGHAGQNIVAKRGSGTSWYILGSHFDSRMAADRDPDPALRTQPVPGADDGAATSAILLELARVLPKKLDKQIWLVFFDLEDQGDLPGWDWIIGSRAFVDSLQGKPDGAVIVDMVGDADLQIYKEQNSDPALNQQLWDTANKAGFTQFIPKVKFSMLDDHTPFLDHHIPAVDLIDFDYPYWHTTQDVLSRISAPSLDAVGETLRLWLTNP